jgi:hypothetical protein
MLAFEMGIEHGWRNEGMRDSPLSATGRVNLATTPTLERDDFTSIRHHALPYWWSMIFSENRYPLFGIMLEAPE